MNICFFNTTAFLGGGEKKHLSYAAKYHELKHRVSMVVSPGSVLEAKCQEQGIPHFSIKLRGLSFLNPLKVKKLVSWFEKEKIDIVFFNGSKDIKTGGKAATLAQVTHRVYWRGIAVSPKPSSLNTKIFGEYLTQVITNSKETKDKIVATIPSAESKTHVVYNGVDFDAFDAISSESDEVPTRKAKLILGNAARLTKQKAQHMLIDLAIKLRTEEIDFEIWIAGKGEEHSNLERLITDRKLGDQVRLLGFVSNMKAFMSAIDILTFPSLWEGFGFSMVEANACGKPVIAFRTSSNPEIIEHNKTGVLVDEINSEAFSDAAIEFIKDDLKRLKISSSCSQIVREKFDLEDQAKEMLDRVRKSS